MTANAKIAIVSSLVICIAGVLWMANGSGHGLTKLTYSQFLEQVRAGRVASVIVFGSNSGAIQATCLLRDGNTARTVLPSDYGDAILAMQDKLVNIEIQNSSTGPLRVFGNAAPFLLLLGIWIVLMRRRRPNGPRQGGLGWQ